MGRGRAVSIRLIGPFFELFDSTCIAENKTRRGEEEKRGGRLLFVNNTSRNLALSADEKFALSTGPNGGIPFLDATAILENTSK